MKLVSEKASKQKKNWNKWLGKSRQVSRLGEKKGGKEVGYIFFMRYRTVLLRFGGISKKFGRGMSRISARKGQAKIPWLGQTNLICCRSPPKQVKLGIYRTRIQPIDHDFEAISGQWHSDITG